MTDAIHMRLNGPVDLQIIPGPEPTVAILDFLASVDPEALEQAALEVTSGLSGPSVGESFLIALKALAQLDA